jgi:acetyl esterase/lipase
MALLIRHQFDREGERASRALVRHLPTGVAERLDQRYDPADGDAYFDVFYPEQVVGTGARLPCIVWVHGGGWILQVAPLRGRRGRRGGSMPGRLGSPQGDDPDP